MSILSKMDLSGQFGPARNQGQRPTCMAFTASDLNRATCGANGDLSAEFLYICAGMLMPDWSIDAGIHASAAMEVIRTSGQPFEVDYPYQASHAVAATAPSVPAGKQMFKSDLSGHSEVMQCIVGRLNGGNPVGLVIRITDSFCAPVNGVVASSGLIVPNTYHAVLATGWGESLSSGRHLRIRNSWSSQWGDAGYAWLPETFVDLHVLEAFGRT